MQRLLSLVNAIVSYGPYGVSSDVFFGTWKELICILQAGSLTLKDRYAICVVVGAFLQHKHAFQVMFGPNAVLLPSLSLLYCWTPTSPIAKIDIVLALIEIDVFKALDELKHIGQTYEVEFSGWLWSDYEVNNAAPVLSLFASVIRASFELRNVDSTSHLEDSRWLDYLSLPENSASIVSIFTFQGSSRTPASVAQVRGDLSFFFNSQSQWDGDILQKCRSSLEDRKQVPMPWSLRKQYRPNVKEANRVIDKLIAKQVRLPFLPCGAIILNVRLTCSPQTSLVVFFDVLLPA